VEGGVSDDLWRRVRALHDPGDGYGHLTRAEIAREVSRWIQRNDGPGDVIIDGQVFACTSTEHPPASTR
jgi:hypothetical protein